VEGFRLSDGDPGLGHPQKVLAYRLSKTLAADAKQTLARYFDFYDRKRPHSALDGKTLKWLTLIKQSLQSIADQPQRLPLLQKLSKELEPLLYRFTYSKKGVPNVHQPNVHQGSFAFGLFCGNDFYWLLFP
jgi:hypothetical protein